tara:strand:+ start:4763 stop:5176 length:414 start_codon:yes stop_codon:yes gene_type:complete
MPISTPIQIFPNDLKPSVGIGINMPFNKPGVFSSNYQTKDAIKNNLINYFLTNTGERFMNPDFGGGLRNFIFEQISDNNISSLKLQIQDQINTFFSRINVLEFDILTNPDQYTITVFLKYSIRNTGMVDSITIDFNQ